MISEPKVITGKTKPAEKIIPLGLIALVAFFAISNSLWFSLDHSFPSQDEAGHILNAWHCQELFAKPHLFHRSWFKELLEVNRCYPPTAYIISGFLKLAFGSSRAVDAGAMVLYNSALIIATYKICRLLKLKHIEGLLAGAIVSLYPLISFYTHSYYLDIQITAAVACGLWALLWWKEKATSKRAILAGLIIGICCMVKHLTVVFIAGGALVIFMEHLRTNGLCKNIVRQWLFMALSALIVIFPWVHHNAGFIAGLTQDNLQNMHHTGKTPDFFQAAALYVSYLPESMSPILLLLFLLSLLLVGRTYHRPLMPLTCSALTGMALTCLWSAASPTNRYIIPALLAPSIYSAILLGRFFNSKLKFVHSGAFLFLALALTQYIAFNFAPYPVKFLAGLPRILGLEMQNSYTHKILLANPQPPEDWGYSLVVEKIRQRDNGKEVWLNVMTNIPQLNAHSFELIAKETSSYFKPTSSRQWTIVGDKILFDPKTVMYYQWFLFKTGTTGYPLFNSEAESNYQKLKTFVSDSGNFDLVGWQILPDGSKLELYRQK